MGSMLTNSTRRPLPRLLLYILHEMENVDATPHDSLELLELGGYLATCSCSYHMGREAIPPTVGCCSQLHLHEGVLQSHVELFI